MTEESATEWDAPNQQVVRGDQSAPWEEGSGGSIPPDEGGGIVDPAPEGLDAMTKDELLEHARSLAVSPANHAMTKEELRAGIDAKLTEG
jgi:hypothetical protein